MLNLGHILGFVEDVVMAAGFGSACGRGSCSNVMDLRPVEQSQHRGTGDGTMMWVGWLEIEAAVDLFPW